MSIRLISEEQKELVLQNMGLVYHLAKKINIAQNDYEDIISIGTIGLIKAAATYDKKKAVFSTYACRCIENEFKMYFRKANKYANDISLEEPIGIDNDGNELTLKQLIISPDSNFVEEIVERDNLIQFINIILNVLKTREKLVMLYKIAGVRQRGISEKLNISQSYISRIEKRMKDKVKLYLNNKQIYKQTIFMRIEDNVYKIYFNSKEIEKFKKVFKTFSKEVTQDISFFKTKEEKILIVLPAKQESLLFIADFFNEIDKCNINY